MAILRDSLTKAAVGGMIVKGRLDVRSMHRNTVDARAKSEKLLFKILTDLIGYLESNWKTLTDDIEKGFDETIMKRLWPNLSVSQVKPVRILDTPEKRGLLPAPHSRLTGSDCI